MNYRERERKKAIDIRESLFRDPGNGTFFGKKREFVLEEPSLNLWEGIREDAQQYFKRNKIPWWQGDKDDPTGHLLSSQVACLNHLYYLRQRKDLATAVLTEVDNEITEALIVDDGYVEFEFIGCKNYLGEKSWKRGANCTSIDAVMMGKNNEGQRIFFLIEWKYTEYYSSEDKYIRPRAEVYDHHIKDCNSPFREKNVRVYYFEPFYQMMRQTLLAWKLIENKDHCCSDYYHIHVIPDENRELMQKITSPYLKGKNISETWQKILNDPDKYKHISPKGFLKPCSEITDSQSLLSYLEKRYWQMDVPVINNTEKTNYFREQSEKYIPKRIKYLLIAESPPIKRENFFYTDDCEKGNQIFFYNIIMAIYNERYKKDIARKKELLNKFKEDGYYLIDAVEYPINNIGNAKRGSVIRGEIQNLIERIRNFNQKGIVNENTKIILIKKLVCDILLDPLQKNVDIIFNRKSGIGTLGYPMFFNDPAFVNGLRSIIPKTE